MTKTTLNNAETTEIYSNKCVLSDILKSMRVSGNMLINEEYVPPWSVSMDFPYFRRRFLTSNL